MRSNDASVGDRRGVGSTNVLYVARCCSSCTRQSHGALRCGKDRVYQTKQPWLDIAPGTPSMRPVPAKSLGSTGAAAWRSRAVARRAAAKARPPHLAHSSSFHDCPSAPTRPYMTGCTAHSAHACPAHMLWHGPLSSEPRKSRQLNHPNLLCVSDPVSRQLVRLQRRAHALHGAAELGTHR